MGSHVSVEAPPGQQLLVGALLRYPALGQHGDAVAVLHRGQAVRNRDARPALRQRLQTTQLYICLYNVYILYTCECVHFKNSLNLEPYYKYHSITFYHITRLIKNI